MIFSISRFTAYISTAVLSNITVWEGVWVAAFWYPEAMTVGPGEATEAAIESAAVASTGWLPVFSMVVVAFLGGAATATWDKLDIAILSYVVFLACWYF